MIDAFVVLVILLVDALLVVMMPRIARCPPKWSLAEGVRRSGVNVGEFACYSPPPRTCGEPKGPYEVPCPPSEKFHARIYCTGGALPIVVDDRTVGCSR